jgi:hypothetical protein
MVDQMRPVEVSVVNITPDVSEILVVKVGKGRFVTLAQSIPRFDDFHKPL